MGKYCVTVKTVPHPDPAQAVDLLARIVLKEVFKREQEDAGIEDNH